MSSPRISVIIVNYNGKELLQKCLESLFKTDYNNFEVILVDNNSTDGSMEFVIKNHPNVIVVKLDSNNLILKIFFRRVKIIYNGFEL